MTKPVLAVQSGDHRVYRHPRTREEVPSVTTVIGMVSKPFLVPWAAKMAAEHAAANWYRLSKLSPEERITEIKNAHKQYAEKRADIGDAVHDLIDCWSKGTSYHEWPVEIDPYINQFISFMTEHRPEFLENEVTLWSRKHNYAGTADWIAKIDGRVILGDNKTGRRVYNEVGLQLSALANADFIIREDGTEEPLPEIEGLAALHIRPRSWKLVPVYEQGECFSAFLAARKLLYWEREIAPNVLLEAA